MEKSILHYFLNLSHLNWVTVEGEKRYNPWAQPGTAPVHGEGCGLNGGNPNGCQGDYEDSSPFGTCCGGTPTSKFS